MKVSSHLHENIEQMKQALPIGSSFDVIQRDFFVGGKKASIFFIDGFAKDDALQGMLMSFLYMSKHEMDNIHSIKEFIQNAIPYIEVSQTNNINEVLQNVLSGPTALYIDGFADCILLDVRTYPARGPSEPDKEKVLRGSRDGFVETIVFNTALIRRRIRDNGLVFEMKNVGKRSKTDVVIGYIKDLVNKKELEYIERKIDNLQVDSLVMNEQSLVESIVGQSWLNPFPKVRFTERPDVAAANLLEGRIVIIVDNSPSVIILPTTIFDFMQDTDDFYNLPITGNYLRFIRNAILFFTLFLTPLWLLAYKNGAVLPEGLQFLLPKDPFELPPMIQLLLLEFAIDGLKLASLNTPGSLGMSLSVVGALILGEFAINTGWFIPQTILYMAIIALGSFAQPNNDLGYAIKFFRIILLLLTGFFNYWGFIIGIILLIVVLITNKTATKTSYIYPLWPFNGKKLLRSLIRLPIPKK